MKKKKRSKKQAALSAHRIKVQSQFLNEEDDLGKSLLEAIKVGDTDAFKEILMAYLEDAVKIKKPKSHEPSESTLTSHDKLEITNEVRNKLLIFK